MVLAIIAGIAIACVSVIPFRLAQQKIRHVNPTHSGSMAAWFAAAIGMSFVILAVGLIVCKLVAHDMLIPFAGAELAAFLVVVIAFGIVSKR